MRISSAHVPALNSLHDKLGLIASGSILASQSIRGPSKKRTYRDTHDPGIHALAIHPLCFVVFGMSTLHLLLHFCFLQHLWCEGVEDVQGVLTLFCSGAAQVVCHALRVVDLREQLEMKRKDGDRQEEEEEVENGEASQGECAMWMTMDGV